jgi:chromosome segregation and condensation protein ScpB
MLEAIKKLRSTKESLLSERNEIDAEVEKIDVALEKFLEGIDVLSKEKISDVTSKAKRKPKKRLTATTMIENMLKESDEPMKVKEITSILHRKNFKTAETTVSSILQTNAKKKKKFIKVAPATYTILKEKSKAVSGGAK